MASSLVFRTGVYYRVFVEMHASMSGDVATELSFIEATVVLGWAWKP